MTVDGPLRSGDERPGAAPVTSDTRARFLAGVRLGAGPSAAVFVLALTFGAAARSAGWGGVLPLLFSMFAFSGSAQFALLTTLPTGTPVASVASKRADFRARRVTEGG